MVTLILHEPAALHWFHHCRYWLLVTAAGWLMLVFFIKAALPFFCCKLTLGVGLKRLAIGASSHPARLRIFQKENFWGWQQGGGFACGTAAFKEDTFFSPCLPTISSMHLWIVATNVLIQRDDRPSGSVDMELCCCYCCWMRSSVRRRKLSCDRRDCEAGCWRFICSGGTAEVTGVKLLHLLAPKVLRNLDKWDF